MPWYLYLALKQLFPSGRRFPFFTAISVLSVALGVALLVLVLGVMSGFGTEVRRMIVDTQGDVQIRASSFIEEPAAVVARVEQVKGVAAATPFAEGVVMIEHKGKPAYPAVQGVDLDRVEKVVPLRKYVRVGSLDDLDDDSVIISSMLAQSIGARMGSTIDVYTPLIMEKLKKEEILLPRKLKVVGIMEVGHQQLDSSVLIVTLRLMQDLYGLGPRVHGINVRLQPDADADEMAALINRSMPAEWRLSARSWYESNQDFLWVLQLEKNMMLFIMLFVVLVAAFLTMSLLLVLVFKKTREIGLLGALGAGSREIALCFCLQGLAVGVVGTLVGLGLGFTALHFRNDAVHLITRFTGSQEVLARFYQFSQLPANTETGDLIVIILSALVLSTLAGLVPAVIAARMKPVDALRSE
ncbi:MAG: ABC transporter permease [Opitutaceae bacterium]|jgi:lipoprotein-releasing system permease protein